MGYCCYSVNVINYSWFQSNHIKELFRTIFSYFQNDLAIIAIIVCEIVFQLKKNITSDFWYEKLSNVARVSKIWDTF